MMDLGCRKMSHCIVKRRLGIWRICDMDVKFVVKKEDMIKDTINVNMAKSLQDERMSGGAAELVKYSDPKKFFFGGYISSKPLLTNNVFPGTWVNMTKEPIVIGKDINELVHYVVAVIIPDFEYISDRSGTYSGVYIPLKDRSAETDNVYYISNHLKNSDGWAYPNCHVEDFMSAWTTVSAKQHRIDSLVIVDSCENIKRWMPSGTFEEIPMSWDCYSTRTMTIEYLLLNIYLCRRIWMN